METAHPLKFIDLARPTTPPPAAPGKGSDALRLSRRGFLGAAATLAAVTGMWTTAFAQNFGDRYRPDAPPVRYPEPDVLVLDKRFKYKLGNTPILRLYRGTLWAEGPATGSIPDRPGPS